MSVNSEKIEIGEIVNRLLDNLALTATSQTGVIGVSLRHQIGDLRANYLEYLSDDTFSTKLLSCFDVAFEANVKLQRLQFVHTKLFEETPSGDISIAIVMTAIGFCLATESKMIVKIEFKSRDDVVAMIDYMRGAFLIARELAADAIDSATYQSLTSLSGAITNFLATVSRPLPRMINFSLPSFMTALSLSQRIYYTAERWEEVVDENHIIHPAFCPRDIRGLSS